MGDSVLLRSAGSTTRRLSSNGNATIRLWLRLQYSGSAPGRRLWKPRHTAGTGCATPLSSFHASPFGKETALGVSVHSPYSAPHGSGVPYNGAYSRAGAYGRYTATEAALRGLG